MSVFEKVYELPLSMDYVRHWGMAEAIREIIQNALDSESPFEWNIENDTLYVYSKFAKLEPKSLLLGTTSKADNKDTIGSFGEGYKIALLVLTRLNYDVTIYNNDIIWKPEFRFNKKFEDKTLCIISTNNFEHKQGVTFKIQGLSDDDIDQVKDSCLYMQKDIGQVKQTSKGLILIDKPNVLFIGGLFICNTPLDFGYDIKPEFIKLERDRQTVSDFNLKYTVKDMWFETNDYDKIAELMEKDCPDFEYAEYTTPEIVKEACYKRFQKEYPDSIVATSQKELDTLIEKGMEKVIIIRSDIYSKSIVSSSSYKKNRDNTQYKLSIESELDEWLKINKKHMRRSAIVNYQELVDKSKTWRRK